MSQSSKKVSEFKAYNVHLKDTIEVFSKRLFYALFDDDEQQQKELLFVAQTFLKLTSKIGIDNGEDLWAKFKNQLPTIRTKLDLDALAFEQNDPAAKSLEEIYLAYPGFHAISIYRLSHELYKLNLPIIPRMMSEYTHGLTGTDIHPGATIGASFFIDHATGIVIGETAVIKDHVKIYQGVTLGGIQIKKSMSNIKRHPTIENNVTIYANATILGGDISVGANSIVGANVWITKSIPENSLVTYELDNKISTRKS